MSKKITPGKPNKGNSRRKTLRFKSLNILHINAKGEKYNKPWMYELGFYDPFETMEG